jgi:hypothetical protein
MNVEELSGQRRTLCFVPKGRVPMGDILLAQKLALELMEEETLKRLPGPGNKVCCKGAAS